MKALLVAIVLLAAGNAAAQSNVDQAAAKFAEGKSHYDLAEYDAAIDAFKEAYRLDRQPLFLYNIAQAYRQEGECRMARTFYRTYLREDPEAYNREKVEKRIEDLAECIRKAGGDPDAPDPVAETELQPETSEPDTTEPAKPVTLIVTEPHVEPPDRTRLYAAGGLGVGALVLGGIGLYFTYKMNSLEDDFSLLCAEDCDFDDPFLRDIDHDARKALRNSQILYGSAGIAAVAAAALVTWHFLDASPRRVGLEPVPSGAMVTASTRF